MHLRDGDEISTLTQAWIERRKLCLFVCHDLWVEPVVPIRRMTAPDSLGSKAPTAATSDAPNDIEIRLTSGIYVKARLHHQEDDQSARLHILARNIADGPVFEVDWSLVATGMESGLSLGKAPERLTLSPMDMYEIDSLGWRLLMCHRIFPTEWAD